jgi:hypothetical protein
VLICDLLTPATIKRILVFMQSARYSYPILTKLGFSRQIFMKVLISNFTEISLADTCGQTDGQTQR